MAILGAQTSSASYGSYAAQRSTVNSYASRQTASTFCPTCGGNAASSSASAACPTCNRTSTAATFTSSSASRQASASCPTCGRTGNSSSGAYCPTCNRGGQSTSTGSRLAATGTSYGQYASNTASSFSAANRGSASMANRITSAYGR